jgi:hypothetical protein
MSHHWGIRPIRATFHLLSPIWVNHDLNDFAWIGLAPDALGVSLSAQGGQMETTRSEIAVSEGPQASAPAR